ncbi:hypothetical protein BC939DRAFT_447308 [Gamsiella multidivaricata]|uniref:uncharacterized protein n=1 Tax=Gamsiella multidivaricata TaxID=101098 RepID=UPI00222036AE|nr:uncharacterized protein BC939DRAFT_447308 [Gamsiella multidivaricata]KAI7826219.1 hypothetical protein BC939DRAFT_447308 [Gamsiella multidivaricata]
MTKSIFAYPELCYALAKHLPHSSLAACLLINRSFYSTFLPYLYSSIEVHDFRRYLPDPTPAAPKEDNDKTYERFPAEPATELINSRSLFFNEKLTYKEGMRWNQVDEFYYYDNDGDEGVNEVGDEEISPSERKATFAGLVQASILLQVVQSCPNLKSLEIHGLNPASPPRPHYGTCGQAAIGRRKYLNKQESQDKAIAIIIKEAAACCSQAKDAESDHLGPYAGLLPLRNKAPTTTAAAVAATAATATVSTATATETAVAAVADNTAFGITTEPPQCACSNTLQTLRIGVSNASVDPTYDDSWYGHRSGYQSWIYAAQITWMHDDPENPMVHKHFPEALHWFYDYIAIFPCLRELCLESVAPLYHKSQSLDLASSSGLDRWATLKALEVLDIEKLDHAVGVDEVQWMVKNWPALREVRGLVYATDEIPSDAALWLQSTRPDIALPVSTISRPSQQEL